MTKAERLFTLLTEVDDVLVEEAAQPFFPDVRKTPWGKWAGLAACLLLAVGLVRMFPFFGGMGSAEPDGAPQAPSNSSPQEIPAESCEPGEVPPTSGESVTGDGDPGEGNPPSGATCGTTVASGISPITGESINLIYREDSGTFLLSCGKQEILLPVKKDVFSTFENGTDISALVHLAVNGCVEGEFYPSEHVSYENYVLISFTKAPGVGTYLVVGIHSDGSFEVNEELYLSHGE